MAQKAGLTQQSGLLIIAVEADSPAEKAGLLVGDMLVAIGETPVADVDALRAQLGSDKLDQTLSMKILRGGEPQQVDVTIGERS